MEAMVAMMIVTIAMTSFISLIAYNELPTFNDDVMIDTSYLRFTVVDNKITGDIQDQMELSCEKYGLLGINVDVRLIGPLFNDEKRYQCGITDSENNRVKNGTLRLSCDDGSIVLASYKVTQWY
ncbi:MAG: hypothetical protein PUK35_01540 [Methanomassiliicoccales archaeon]|uniref:hypothetical protein n=1 Tax=Candidatus Methanarcanum hacksteinii TaxID=2911857 RepID=UPI0026FE8D84|nr:hypothetical protein [Candidatus Methanomethylophilaceae archaeon]MCI6025520.1 hypothetical protein [Methanomassiliicoccales archaeon]MDD7478529.1 hypothetical protein [Methanomassiliicoccales archaeon]MDO5837957.1 hypothetical protein [Methanomassiliicoccales archaeon]MDY4581037.1 hypothetical protein [Candidatus Methanarcanum hacksteinii]